MGDYVIPFLVADRPASLRIIKGSGVQNFNVLIGLMGHANTSPRFQKLFGLYPCGDEEYCDVVEGECPCKHNIKNCPCGLAIQERTIKICDSGIFTKEGCTVEQHESLFKIYTRMNVDYGVMIDYFKNSRKTIESAKDAIEVYNDMHPRFELVGVAQGNSLSEYLHCYDILKNLGYKYIAVGGLLKKNENTARYVRVRSEELLFGMLSELRKRYPKDWLFPLGCYHPKRHAKFIKLGIYGGDYKGWIFNYKKQDGIDKTKAQKVRFAQVRKYLRKTIYSTLAEDRMHQYLLILSCSKKKDTRKELLPAVERYEGPFFNILRKSSVSDSVDVLILSAKYGLIDSKTKIECYDQLMNRKRAQELRDACVSKLKKHLEAYRYDEIFVNLGEVYLQALDGLEGYIPETTKLMLAQGRIGQRSKQLRTWLSSVRQREPLRLS